MKAASEGPMKGVLGYTTRKWWPPISVAKLHFGV
jgi:hypothetical protein